MITEKTHIRRLLLSLVAVSAVVATLSAHGFAEKSVLDTGHWVRISVSGNGLYKITYDMLKEWGVEDPANPRIYGYGGERLSESFKNEKKDDLPQVAVWMEKGSDGIFNSGDYLLFYAQGINGWTYNSALDLFTHTRNIYSGAGYYFVTSGIGTEKTMRDSEMTQPGIPATKTLTTFRAYDVYEDEETNLLSSGQIWFGEEYKNSSTHYYDFSMPNISQGETFSLRIATASTVAASSFTATVNGSSRSYSTVSPGANNKASYNVGVNKFEASEDDIELGLKFNGSSGGPAYLDYIEINATRNLVMSGTQMTFTQPQAAGEACVEYRLTGEAGLKIADITDRENGKIINAAYSNGIHSFKSDETTLKRYVAFNPQGSYPVPEKVEDVSNQNLHGIKDANLIIITNGEYMTEAEMIADLHRKNDGISVLVVTPQTIYNEYSSGTPDATAFRWLVKSIYDRASEAGKPQNLLLLGDATYDPMGYVSANKPYNKVLTYESENSVNKTTGSYPSDDYFAKIGDTSGENLTSDEMSIGVGRIPVSSTGEARAAANKIASYMTDSLKGAWKNKFIYIADDDNDNNLCYTWQSDTIAKRMETSHKEIQVTRMFTDAYMKVITSNGASYPLVQQQLMNNINSGTMFVNYIGHGSTEGMAGEKFFDKADILGLKNKRYPFFYTATCDFSDFDKPTLSAGELLILQEKGGAIGMVTASRTVYSTQNFELDKEFHKHFLTKENGKPITFGEAYRLTKNARKGDTNRNAYVLFGDPALRFQLPARTVTADSINEVDIDEDGNETIVNSTVVGAGSVPLTANDTLKALSKIRVTGSVMAEDGVTRDLDFNGMVTVTVMDKLKSVTTLGNATGGETTYTYNDRPNTLFKGKCEARNGRYSMVFMVPKDIMYNYGKGRISLYALSGEGIEGTGYNEDVVVGGANAKVEYEENGPQIEMYLNSPNFVNGGKIDQSSILYAHVSDDSGINTTGSGIGHDLQVQITGDTVLTYILNDYFESELNTYKSGNIKFPLTELALNDGCYTMTLRAWDLMNNSSTATLDFCVNKNLKTGVYRLQIYPNPVDRNGTAHILIEHDQPETELNVKTELYDVAGNRIVGIGVTPYSDNDKTTIDLDLNGVMAPGVYVYRVWISTDDNGKRARSGNIIVK